MKHPLVNLLCILSLSLAASCGSGKTAENDGYVPAPADVMMYQINPRVFAPDHSFNAIALQLDSIASLGANVVWFMPIYETGQVNGKNSPYCIKNYTALNPEFGTLEEFKAMIDECHKRGMAVIVDWVANHTSWDNAWMEHKDWYTQDTTGTVIYPEGTNWTDVADLNFDNQEMRLAMIDAMKFWVTEAGVDGFRCDAADFVPYDFWKQALDSLRAIPDKTLLMLAEGKRKDHFDAGFEMNYAWDFMASLRDVFIRDSTARKLYATDTEEYAGIPEGCVKLRFTTNHDEAFKMSPIAEYGGERGSMSAFVISAYLHGGALIYGSQEVGYPDPINFFHYVAVDWTTNNGLRQEYKQLMSLYNSYPAIRKGSMTSYPDDDVMLFVKSDGKDSFLIAASVRDTEISVAVPETWAGKTVTDMMSGQSITLGETLELLPYQYLILK